MTFGNTVIFGDSYSTFAGHIPEGYAVYYTEHDRPETDVRKVTETWWHLLHSETDSNLLLNNSWSGSTIGYTGYNNTDCSASSSFIYRFEKLLADGFFTENRVDTVFVFGGTNDSWCGASVGSLMYGDWKKEDLYSVLPAVTRFFSRLREALPGTEIICLINCDLKPEIMDGMEAAAVHYGIRSVRLHDVHKNCGHPTVAGMRDICDQVLAAFR